MSSLNCCSAMEILVMADAIGLKDDEKTYLVLGSPMPLFVPIKLCPFCGDSKVVEPDEHL